MYVPLFAVLVALYMVPRDSILALPVAGRLLWTLFAVPLPIFFAGLILPTTFHDAASPSMFFGANLIGAMIGRLLPNSLGMATGNHNLALLVIGAYLGSLVCLTATASTAGTDCVVVSELHARGPIWYPMGWRFPTTTSDSWTGSGLGETRVGTGESRIP